MRGIDLAGPKRGTYSCADPWLHDAHVVSTMLEHELTRLVTDDVSDVKRFGGLELVDLAPVPVS